MLAGLFILGWLSAAAGSAAAHPITSAPDGTNTVVTPNGNRYDISGGSLSPEQANLFHSFTEFGLSEGQIANFLTNPNIQNILGRITGGNPSLINGLIQVTGGNSNLFLMNPAGMIFGPNASLNVPGSFNATTATGIGFGNNQWFSAIGNNNWATLIGKPNSFAFTTLQGGSIVNAGNLTVTPGQSLSLVAGTVVNTGQLNAPSGNILISAVPDNNLVRISQAGNLLSLDIVPTATGGALPNNWTQPVLSLPQLLTGKGAPQATSLTVNPKGEVVLTGNVAVPGTAGTAIASGTLNVSGDTGGNVNILGEKVGVIAGNINASGINGGGNVLIGGDYQGLGTVPNALRTFVSSDSTINADAVSNGQGGRVIVWADETTRFNGNISARGGLFSGNGGFAEVSGKQSLDFQGLVDLRSTFGIAGTLLLDPTDITISTDPDTVGNSFSPGGEFAPGGGTSTINNGTLENQLGKGSVTISTASKFPDQGNITVSAPITWGINSLTLKANNSIFVNNSLTSFGGNITLNADVDGTGGGAIAITNAIIKSNGGNIILGGGSNPLIFPAEGTVYPLLTYAKGANAIGVEITNSTLDAATGNISITGKGLAGTSKNHGISVSNSGINTAGTGSIILNGIGGNGTGSENKGINIFFSTVASLGTGSIILNGTGGNGANSNQGISLGGTTVLASSGNVSLTGTGGGAGTLNHGIYVDTVAVPPTSIQTAGGGNVTLKGTGSAGTGSNLGIYLNTGTVRSNNGDIALTGIGVGTSPDNDGIRVDTNGLMIGVEATGTGNISITGEANNNAIALNLSNIGIQALLGGNVTLTGDEIQLSGTTLVNGKGTITLQPQTQDKAITIGGANQVGFLNLEQAELNKLNGFSQMVIGRADGTGAIVVDPAGVQFNSLNTATIIQPPTGTGSIAVNGPITAQGDITFNGATSLSADVTASDKIITFNSPVTVANKVNLNTGAGAGKILFQKTVDGTTTNTNSQDLTLTAGSGNITFGGDAGSVTPLGNLTINSAENVQTKAITANSITQSAGTGTTAFKGAVTTNAAGGINLTGTNFALDNPVKTLNNGTFKVNNSGELNIATAANLLLDGEFTQSGTGQVNIASNITTTNDNISFNSPVTLTNDVSFNTDVGAGDIIFNNTVDSKTANSPNLTLTAGTGNIRFTTGAIGNSTTPFGAITANSSGTTSFASTVNAQSLTTDSGGTTQLNDNVTTTGPQTYGDAVTIANNPILSGSDISFNNTVDGSSALTVKEGTGNVTFNMSLQQALKLMQMQ
jgi:filamentous hemagglutinin family protein